MAQTIRTTHVGSLPRPPHLRELLIARERGEIADDAQLGAAVSAAVEETVARQASIGITMVNDGEMGKMTYATYVTHRFGGIAPYPPRERPPSEEARRFPQWAHELAERHRPLPVSYEVDAPLHIKDTTQLEADLARLRAAVDKAGASEAFMNAASPGIVAAYIPDRYYGTPQAYLNALVEVLRPEYEAIVAAGFILQLDCPDLSALGDDDDKRKELAVDAINAATAGIDPALMRMHLCWGNYQGPHLHDVPLAEVFPLALRARPMAIAFEAANPRHEHEWTYFEANGLPDDKVLIPGVIDNTTTFVEHPELVAQRIERYVRMFGADRVIAGVDCGFATWALSSYDPELAYAKLETLVAGAKLASSRSANVAAGRA